ncbi:GNAT family N-acetyltransferase [Granulicella sp. WH15]|uniref:bifunctional helix-turn-helix transcriptional regulator/GNAT family N-acetyltransferase n=1 Tax=Granulicella sp. WH15 TaxID=2602070 RepID=UPI001366C088|nr:helix-turn-helix domain-containing GNAT family N-acetyltransferase [Granulicella sp. WH15]QHN02824.1 GNAT family N-acetyltransferase [Granulicella sp. WH15]
MTPTDDIALFRRFNRRYTRWIGTLNEGLLESEFTLAEARVIYELGTRPAPLAKEIAEELGMDAGYLSRLLNRFEETGLLKRKASKLDGRSAELALTAKGRAAFKRLNTRSDAQANQLLEGFTPANRARLIASVRTLEELLAPSPVKASYTLRPHRVGDMGWVAHREGLGYTEQFGWDETFEALVAKIAGDFVTNFDPNCERCWIAEMDGRSVGHIFLVKHPDVPGTAKLRLLFVEPEARGLGLGDALVKECIEFARAAGYKRVVLWTQSMLTSAIHIYERAGFRLIKEEPHHSFGKDLVGQEWELLLV